MRNPWIKKNPLMSIWMSGANSMLGAARGRASAEAKRQATAMTQNATTQTKHFWSSVMTAPPRKARKSAKYPGYFARRMVATGNHPVRSPRIETLRALTNVRHAGCGEALRLHLMSGDRLLAGLGRCYGHGLGMLLLGLRGFVWVIFGHFRSVAACK